MVGPTRKCATMCVWLTFEPWAHQMMALWGLVSTVVGQDRTGSPVYDWETARLNQYLDAEHELTRGESAADILDAMAICKSAFNNVT